MSYLNKHFIKGPISLGELNKWANVSGPMGGYLYVVLRYRMGLGKYGDVELVTLPRDVKKHFGLGRRTMERLRSQLPKAGLLEAKQSSGGPYKYRILDGKK